MNGAEVRTFEIFGDWRTLRAVVDTLGPCLVNAWDGRVVCTYDTPVPLAPIAPLHPRPCQPPYSVAAPSAAVLRDGWLTPNDPDRSLWEDGPLSGRLTICDGLVARLYREHSGAQNLRVHAGGQRWEGRPERALERLRSLSGQTLKLEVRPVDRPPKVQTTLGRYFSRPPQAP